MKELLELILPQIKAEHLKHDDLKIKMYLRAAFIEVDRALKRIIYLKRKKVNNELDIERAQKAQVAQEQFKAKARAIKQQIR